MRVAVCARGTHPVIISSTTIWRPECSVVFTGYQVRGTPGRHIVDGAKRAHIWRKNGDPVEDIHYRRSFSPC
jgi:metallo-beta-lactamase family protein